MPEKALIAIYYAIFQTHLNFGLSLWGQASEIKLQKVRILQNKVVRKISDADYDTSISIVYKSLKILKLNDLLSSKIMSIMWDYDHNILPTCLNEFFVNTNNENHYDTRAAEIGLIQVHPIFRPLPKNSFVFKGKEMINEMKTNAIYNPIIRKKTFLSNVKKEYVENYN